MAVSKLVIEPFEGFVGCAYVSAPAPRSTSVHEMVPGSGCSSVPLNEAGRHTGLSLTGSTVTSIVAAFDASAPSLAPAVKLSVPL